MTDQTTASPLAIAVEHSGDFAVVRCRGRLVAGVRDDFYSEVRQLFPGCRRVVLDLAELTHMDSLGIGTLVRLYVSGKSAGCALELANLGKPIRHLLGITHVLSVFGTVGENCIRM